MHDEFDDDNEDPAPAPSFGSGLKGPGAAGPPAPRLVARLYRTADARLRPMLLACLLRPLGTLSLMAVAGGAFAGYLQRGRSVEALGDLDDLARVSGEHIAALASFVEEVNPRALDQFAQIASDNAIGLAAFGASTVVLLYRVLRRTPGAGTTLNPFGPSPSKPFDQLRTIE
jgi:hypothetical protein